MSAEILPFSDETEVASNARDKDARPTIEIVAGELPRMVEQAQDALIRAQANIYQRGGELVRVIAIDLTTESSGIRRAPGSMVIAPVTREYLSLALSRVARWIKYDSRAKKHRAADVPAHVPAALLACGGEWRFRTLTGIVCAPTLRTDGSLLSAPGFDAQSGLYASFDANDFPPVAARPTRDDANSAVARLRDVFNEFEFSHGAESAHASVLIAATITSCVRQALRTAPAFAISAAKQGSGKTTAACAIAQIPLGREAPVLSHTEDENEMQKALLALLIAGDPVILIDNVARPVDSAALCAVLTNPEYRGRLLGASKQVTVGTASTWLITGNHLEFVGDLTSRTVFAELDPQCEHPESRPFKRNLAVYVAEHRGELLAAALTISLAYRAAGSPRVDARRSRFPEWDLLVRFPLLWLGLADPLETQAELRAVDPIREALVAVLTAWRETFGTQSATVADATHAATAAGMSERPRLRDALVEVAGERNGDINSRRLGRYLSRHLRRIEGGLRLEDAGSDPTTSRRMFRVTSVISVSSNPSQASCSDAMYMNPVENNADNAGIEEDAF